MLTAVLADITTQVDQLTHDELRRWLLSALHGPGLGRTPVPASTPSHGMTPLKCLPNPSAGHER